jgi:hypothetical protein
MTFRRAINYASIFTLIQNLARASTTDGWLILRFEYDLHIIALYENRITPCISAATNLTAEKIFG